jgi:hypothetical protein
MAANLHKEHHMYERPEIFEIGAAETLTLGRPNLPCDDNCGCTQSGTVIIIKEA